MPPIRSRSVPVLDRLEGRELLSTSPLPHSFVNVPGTVFAPGAVATVTVDLPASHFQRRSSTLFEAAAQPIPGSALNPRIIAATGPNGQRLPVRPGAPFVPGVSGFSRVFIADPTPGPITVAVRGSGATSGKFVLSMNVPGDVLGTGQVSRNDQKAFAQAYTSVAGDGYYNPAADANQNGQVGQLDGKLQLRNVAPTEPNIPITVALNLAPQDEAKFTGAKNSGGITYKPQVTVEGHTMPGSLVFADNGIGDYSFNGPAIVPDAHGNFSIPVKLTTGLTNLELMVIDPYGKRIIRAFPILWLNYKP
jgi:hypothetical protein